MDVILSCYRSWWAKVSKKLVKFRRGKGVSIVEEVGVARSPEVADCLCHVANLVSVCERASCSTDEVWVKKMLKKARTWRRLIQSAMSRSGFSVTDSVVDSLIEGRITLDEIEHYAC